MAAPPVACAHAREVLHAAVEQHIVVVVVEALGPEGGRGETLATTTAGAESVHGSVWRRTEPSSWSSVAKPRPRAVEIRLKASSVRAGIALATPGVAPRVVT
jgi:hypothetical protein